MNFHATITDRKTGRATAYTQDTLDEYVARCIADGLCTKKAASGKLDAPDHGLINARNGVRYTALAPNTPERGFERADWLFNPEAVAAGQQYAHTNSFAAVRLTKDEKEWLGKSVRFVGTGELRQFIPEGEFESRGTVWSMAPGTRRCWVLTEDRRFALVYLDRLITD